MPTRLTLSYYSWITQTKSGPDLARAIAGFAGLLHEELRRRLGNDLQLEVLKEMEVPEQLDQMKAKPAGGLSGKIGLLNPIGYALAHAEVADVKAVTVICRKLPGGKAGPTYKAQLYTHRKTAIRKVKDARGRSMAFGSPHSTSNFLVPAVMLWKQGIHPLNGFSRVEFTGGHSKSAIAVYEGRLEVGAGHDGVIVPDLASKPGYGDAEQVLMNLEWSDPIPSDPVAVHAPDSALRDQIRDALCEIAKPGEPDNAKSPGNKAVNEFWGTTEGFEPIAPEAYAPLLSLLKGMDLRPGDMLRKA